MEEEKQGRELDDFLSDLHRLLDDDHETAPDEEPEEPDEVPEDPQPEEESPAEEIQKEDARIPQILEDLENLEAMELPADSEDIDVDSLLARAEAAEEPLPADGEPEDAPADGEPEEPPAEAPEEEPAEEPQPEHGAKKKAREVVSWTQKQWVPRHVAKLQKNQEQAYADWLYEQEQHQDDGPPPEIADLDEEILLPTKKKHHYLRNILITLVVLALVISASAVFLLPRQPEREDIAMTRREGVSTILLLGTDEGGARTDAMILLTVDAPAGKVSMVSVPRDTLVQGDYVVPKLNSVYGANGGGQEGIEMLEIRLSQCIGFMPDGYILVQLDSFRALVDALGGVTFDVPMDMVYDDPSQDLHIDLKAGTQHLNGEEAMEVMRFRSGYPDADLGRIQVQRNLLGALLYQSVTPGNAVKLPQLLNLVLRDMHTDLSAGNLLWLARSVLSANLGSMESATLPGRSAMIGDGSYYILDPAGVAQTINACSNPYEQEISPEKLEIRQG